MKKALFLLMPALLISACGGNSKSDSSTTSEISSSELSSEKTSEVTSEMTSEITSEVTSEESSESTSIAPSEPDFVVDDVRWLYTGSPRKIQAHFNNGVTPKEIEYEYDSLAINIDDDGVVSLAKNVDKDTQIEVTAVAGEYKDTFTITARNYSRPKSNGGSHPSHLSMVTPRYNARRTSDYEEGGTIFFGDSFFDPGFWGSFEREVTPIEGKTRFLSGISATTMEEWFGFADKLVYEAKPDNVVIHIGTNDYWDLNRTTSQVKDTFVDFMGELRANMPSTNIYYISIENRTYATSTYGSSLKMAKELKDYNAFAKEYCDNHDGFHFIDSFTHFTDKNGYAVNDMFKDGTHPNNEEYSFFIKEAIRLGLNDITYTQIYFDDRFEFTENLAWGGTTTFIKHNGKKMVDKFLLTSTATVSFNPNKNCHFGFQFGIIDNRFLMWNNGSGSKLYSGGAYFGIYHGTSSHFIDFTGATEPKEMKIQLLVTSYNAYFILNDVLTTVFYYISNCEFVSFASENTNVALTDIVIDAKGEESGNYEAFVGREDIQKFETDTSKTQKYIEVK